MAGAAQVPALACADSDGGNSPLVLGTVTFKGQKFTDVCVKGQLQEYSCKNGVQVSNLQNCAAGSVCENGACVRREQCQVVNGVVRHTNVDGRVTNYAPTCNPQGNAVLSYSCLANGSISITTEDCPDGEACAGFGVCTSLSCEPTENGILLLNNSVEQSFENFCDQFNRALVYVCTPFGSGEIWRNNLGQCAQGTVCQEGECVGQ